MGIPLGSNFDLTAGLPLDARVVVADLTARDAIPPVQRFIGLEVWVDSEVKKYRLQAGITNGDWVEITDTGLSGSYVDLSTNQTAAGEKTWSDLAVFSSNVRINASLGIGRDPLSKLDIAAGNIYLDNNYGIRIKDTGGTHQIALHLNVTDNLLVGDYALAFLTLKTGGDILLNAGSSQKMRVNADGSIIMDSLGSDDTEDHVIAIDDSTGLLTKRSVSSIQNSGLFVDLTTVQTAAGAKTWSDNATFNGLVEILTSAPSGTAGLNIIDSNNRCLRFANTEADTTTKVGFMLAPHYLAAEQDVLGFWFSNLSSGGRLIFGGGSGSYNAVNSIHFYTADGSAITGGTVRMKIIGDGKVGIGGTAAATPLAQLHIDGGVGTLSTGLAFGDGDSGFYEGVDDVLAVRISGADTFVFEATDFRGSAAFTPWLQSTAGSSTDPVYAFNTDTNTGIGRAAADQLSLIAGGVEAVNVQPTISTFPATVQLTQLNIESATTTILKDGGNNMAFTDAITGTKTLAELSFVVSLGTAGQIPYMNGTTDFSYSASLHYTTGVLNTPNINVAAIAAGSTAQLVTAAVATGALASHTGLTYDGTTLDIATGKKGALESLLFKQGSAIMGVLEGLVWWNDDEYTLNIDTGLGPVLQVGQETYLLIYNDTVSPIANFTVLRPKGAFLVGSLVVPTVQEANASTWLGVEGTLMVATMIIPAGQVGLATRFGRARGGDGSGGIEAWGAGDQLYVSETDGLLTNIRPDFPSYNISIGGVIDNQTAPDGEIFVSLTRNFNDTFDNFHNGTIRESFAFTLTEAAGVVTGHLADTEGNDLLTYLFTDGFYLVDVSTPPSIVLTNGTDTDPVTNYVFIPQSTKVLTVNTTGFPVVEHIKVAQLVLQAGATTGAEGPLRNQNFNDHLQDTAGQGHLAHIGAKLRRFDSQWDSGAEGAIVINGAPDDVWVTVTGGSIFQMHPQPFDAFDTEAGDHLHVVNNFATSYLDVSNLNGQILDANNQTLNNRAFSFVLWGVVNSAGEASQLMMNLPTDSYS
jgi:hypothetical protein